MSLIFLAPWRTQPQWPARVDLGAPINQGLVLLVPLGPGDANRDFYTGAQGTPTGLTTRRGTTLGTYPQFDSSNYLDLTLPGGISGTTPITIAFTYRQTAQTDAYPVILAWKPTGATNQFLITAGPTASYNFAVGPRDGVSSGSEFASAAPPMNVDRACLITLTAGTDSLSTSSRRLWINGVNQPFIANTSFGVDSGAGFRLGKNYTLSNYFEGSIGNFHIWNRVLTDNEAQAWTLNPFMTRQPIQRRFWSFAAAGATTINATPGAYSWAGTTANIPVMVAAVPAAWSWTGLTSAITQAVNAAVGAYTWAGANAALTQLTSATPGAYSWAGTTATIDVSGQITATPGAYTWAGTTATTTYVFTATPGAWAWAGTAATLNQSFDAAVGQWTWQGVSSSVQQTALLDAFPAAWTWGGVQAAIASDAGESIGSYGTLGAGPFAPRRWAVRVLQAFSAEPFTEPAGAADTPTTAEPVPVAQIQAAAPSHSDLMAAWVEANYLAWLAQQPKALRDTLTTDGIHAAVAAASEKQPTLIRSLPPLKRG